jgi:hypothetical protein
MAIVVNSLLIAPVSASGPGAGQGPITAAAVSADGPVGGRDHLSREPLLPRPTPTPQPGPLHTGGVQIDHSTTTLTIGGVVTGAAPVPVPYYVHLDKFHIDDTRASHNDTDLAALIAKQEPSGQTSTATWGPQDVNNGDHALGLVLGPFYSVPDDSNSLVFNYSIVNSGHSSADTVLDALIQGGLQAAGSPFGLPGTAVASILGALVNELFANCDGIVVADQFGPYTGGQLALLR